MARVPYFNRCEKCGETRLVRLKLDSERIICCLLSA
jgi:hypothetical protein